MATEKTYMTPDDVCEYLTLKKSTLYKYVHRNQIPHLKIQGGLLRFKRPELDKWAESFRQPLYVH